MNVAQIQALQVKKKIRKETGERLELDLGIYEIQNIGLALTESRAKTSF